MKLHEIAGLLIANLSNLPERDRDFARSLAEKAVKANLGGYQLSEKQKHWVIEMARKATGRQAPQAQQPQPQANFQPIVAFLQAARQHLAKPILRVAVVVPHPYEPNKTQIEKVRLTIAGPRSKYPGSLNITAGKAPQDGERAWYGSISVEGRLFLSNKFEAFQRYLREALTAVAKDPAGAAKLFGQLTSACCFCGAELTDGASIAVGYGPICADHWGLPHGDDHGVKGGHRHQDEIAKQLAPKAEAPIVPTKGIARYEAPKQPEKPVQELNDPIDDLWVDGFVGQ